MSSRFFVWCFLVGAALAGGVVAWREGHIQTWKHWVREWTSGSDQSYSKVRFNVDLVDRLNYPRIAAKLPVLRVDTELDTWLEANFPTMDLSNMEVVTREIQGAMPRYFRVSVCSASGPTLRALLDQFQDFSQKLQPEMTHLGCAVRESVGGLARQSLVVVGQRLRDFTPEALADRAEDAFFSRCLHCKHPHIVRISKEQNSLGLECPECRRTYAVVAADEHGRFRYVNEFLTGYSPPAVFSRDQSRVHELFTIWSAVHSNCVYTKDPGEKKQATDCWQTSLETQRLGRGDCEDSAIFLCDWLLARNFQARVALGRYGDLGGHAWVVVKLDDREYLLESTEGRPDPTNPPLASQVGSRYIPEVLFDRQAIYVRSSPSQTWKGDYWSHKVWTRIEPRELNPESERLASFQHVQAEQNDPRRLGRTSLANPAASPFMDLGDIPRDAGVWQQPLFPAGEPAPKR